MCEEHEWAEVQFIFGEWIACRCGFRPNSQEEMDAHIPPPEVNTEGKK
jgi:hypothetical protein